MYFLLFYDYVEGMLEKRLPYREKHLALAQEYVLNQELILGGAYAEPVDGAVIIFHVQDKARVEYFVQNDPYVKNHLVRRWHIRAYSAVVGTAL